MNFYALITMLIPPWLLMLMAATAAAGWLWRLRLKNTYVLPTTAKVTEAIGWIMAAMFYAMVQFADRPLANAVALSRLVWLVLMINAVVQHVYILRINRYVEKRMDHAGK